MASFDATAPKSAADLEFEVEAQRSRVADTIDEIQDKLSPGQLVDQIMDFTKGGAGDFAQNMGKSLRDNPLPVALLGVSLLWLMSGKGSTGSTPAAARGRPADPVGYRYGDSDALRSQAYGEQQNVGGMFDTAKDAATHVGDGLSSAASAASDALHQIGDKSSELFGEVKSQVSDVTASLTHHAHDARESMSGLQSTVMTMLRDQPLVAGALAFAAGAALGAAIPVTAKENELMGEAADQVKATIDKVSKPLVDEGKAALDDAVDKGTSLFDNAVEKGKAAISDAKHTVGDGLSGLNEA